MQGRAEGKAALGLANPAAKIPHLLEQRRKHQKLWLAAIVLIQISLL